MIHMQKSITLLLLLLVLFFAATAQQKSTTISVTGTVQENMSGKPVELAAIQLLRQKDSTVCKTVLSDRKGKFQMDSVSPGSYLLRINYVGMVVKETTLNIAAENRLQSLGIILLELASHELTAVSVTAKKAMLTTAIDRKVYNVGQDIMAQSGSVSDILKNVPSVEVDIEGNISLRGSEEVMVLINGRPSPLMGKNRAEVLQQIPANTIERIEVITNPSARFRPDGTSGIINIVLKKNAKGGFNGNLTGNIGNLARANSSLTLNLKTAKWNSFATYSIRQDERNRYGSIDRQLLDASAGTSGYYTEDSRSKARPLGKLFRAGMEYTLDAQNSIGISGSFLRTDLVRNNIQSRYFYDKNRALTTQQNRLRYAPAFEIEKDATLFWQHNFKKEGAELRLEATASSQSEDEKNYYTNQYIYPANKSIPDNNWVTQIEKNQQVTLDYVNPLSESAKIEMGYAGSFVQQDIDFYVENFDSTRNKMVRNALTSNRFLYDFSLQAFYATFQKTYQAFSFSLGLRAEQAYMKINLLTRDSLLHNQYFQLYPTLHLAYQLPHGELQLNYSRRANRPDGDDLNPFPEYIDPLNLTAGNPQLLPEFIHSLEFGYQWKNRVFTIVPSIYYRSKYNGFTTVTRPYQDSVLLTTRENLSSDQSAGFELIVSAKPSKTLTANLSSNVFYNTIDASAMGLGARKSIVSMNMNFNTTYSVTPTAMFQFSCNYRSARQTAQGQVSPTFVMNLGARKDLFQNKLSITATLSDIFRTLEQKSVLHTTFLNQTSTNSRDARVFYIGFNFRFGSSTRKPAEEKLQFDNTL
jgi:outer membrane receptor protein involved in Fe transport